VVAAGLLAAFVVAAAPVHADPDVAGRMAELGAGSGFVYRRASTDPGSNPGGIRYGGFVGIDAQARVYVVPWLRVAVYYLGGYASIDIPRGAASIEYDELDLGKAWAFSLGGRVEPTWHVSDRFRAFGIVGAGWGRMKTPPMQVKNEATSYAVDRRAGVWIEFPVGLGATVDVVRDRLGLSFESTLAPHSSQSGSLFGAVQYVDSSGTMGHVQGMPKLSLSLATMLNVVVEL